MKPEEREFVVDSGASMHMLSRKDLDSAKLETLRVSKSPTTVVTANGEVLTNEEATACVRELDLFVTAMLLEDTPAVLSLGKLCEDHGYTYAWTSGQKPHLIKNGRKIDCNTANYVPFVVPGLSTSFSSSSLRTSPTSSSQETVTPTELPASTRSESMSEEVRGNSSHGPAESENTNKNGDGSSSSHELPSESRAKVVSGLGNHSVCTHFPKNPNCDICLKTKITRASCRRRAGYSRAQSGKIGGLMTADRKVLREGFESRNNHRYAVVVQDLATLWIQSCPCESKTSQETQKSLLKLLEPTRKPKVMYTDNSLEFGKSCDELSLRGYGMHNDWNSRDT